MRACPVHALCSSQMFPAVQLDNSRLMSLAKSRKPSTKVLQEKVL